MSMNIYIEGEREIIIVATNKREVQTVDLNVWQTPTKVSYEIEKAKNPVQAYFDWVASVSEDEELPIYADDDIFNERDPIGTEIYNAGKEHIKELKEEIEMMEKSGYKFVVHVW